MKNIFKANFFVCLFLFLFSACANNNIVVKYKKYKFNEYIKLKTTVFKPFEENISFKAKIILTMSNGKRYKFYALIYNSKDSQRIFAYSFFGKRVIDIMFDVKNYLVIDGKSELYIVEPNSIDQQSSLFWFFKEVLNGIEISDSRMVNNCLNGTYKGFNVRSCEKDDFKKVFMYKNNRIVRSFEISDDKDGFPKYVAIKVGGNKLEVLYKKKIEEENFKKSFFDYVKKFKVYYIRNMKSVEKEILK